MLKKVFLLLVLFYFFSNETYSQVFKSDTSNSTKVNVFNSPTVISQFDKAYMEDYKYAVKINPLLILSGDIPFYFEYKLGKKISAEVGLGPTIRNFWLEILEEDSYTAESVNSNKIGRSLRLALRFYPSSSEEAIIGYYFAPELMIRRFYSASVYTDFSGTNTKTINYELETNQIDCKVIFGYQDSFDSNLILDYYLGFGLRNSDKQVVDFDSNSSTYLSVLQKQALDPTLTLGLKLGFGF